MPTGTEEQTRTEIPDRGVPAVQVFSWPLSSDPSRNVKAELRIFGRDLRPEDVERLKRYLDLGRNHFRLRIGRDGNRDGTEETNLAKVSLEAAGSRGRF